MMRSIHIFLSCFFIAIQVTAQTLITPPLKPEVVFVKGGTFQMGNTNENKAEMPVHSITVSDFSIGKYEVTVSQYRAFCEETGREMPSKPDCGWEDNYPIDGVSYFDALAYCAWLSEKFGGNWRLPTEAEWEYAARGGSKSQGYTYAGGNDLDQVGWYEGNANYEAKAVGLKKSNELGIYDMSGNLQEWCEDWADENYYANSPRTNPKGPAEGTERVLRGGSWYLLYWYSSTTRRSLRPPDTIRGHIGFRVVLSH